MSVFIFLNLVFNIFQYFASLKCFSCFILTWNRSPSFWANQVFHRPERSWEEKAFDVVVVVVTVVDYEYRRFEHLLLFCCCSLEARLTTRLEAYGKF